LCLVAITTAIIVYSQKNKKGKKWKKVENTL
jgi:hypothetical protein